MMFYSPYELFSHIKLENISNYEKIKNLPRNTEIERLRADFCENDFNIRFLESVNSEFFYNIIRELNIKKEYILNQLRKCKSNEYPQQENLYVNPRQEIHLRESDENLQKDIHLKQSRENLQKDIREELQKNDCRRLRDVRLKQSKENPQQAINLRQSSEIPEIIFKYPQQKNLYVNPQEEIHLRQSNVNPQRNSKNKLNDENIDIVNELLEKMIMSLF